MIKKPELMINDPRLELELTDEYKLMMDAILDDEQSGNADYVSFDIIKNRFMHNDGQSLR